MPTRELGFAALMTAVYARLTTHALTNGYAFYNAVPRTATMPYHVIGKPMGKRSDGFTTRDSEGEDNVFQIDSWLDETSGVGDKACADIQNNIMQALTSSTLSVTGYHSPARFVLEYVDIILDPENPELKIRHGILRFRCEMAPSS